MTDALGRPLEIEVSSGSQEPQIADVVGENWRRLGIDSSVRHFPPALLGDAQALASFPGAWVSERNLPLDRFFLLSDLIPTPPGYLGTNRGGFSNTEIDRLFNLVISSVETSAQQQVAVSVNKLLSEMAAYMPLYYVVDVVVARSRLKGPTGEFVRQEGFTHDIFEWEVVN